MTVSELVEALWSAKRAEAEAKERRMALEAELAGAIGVPEEWEGQMTKDVGLFKVKLTRRMNVKIDEIRLRELARVNNILPVLETCFRWKPEIVKREWDGAEERVRTILAGALEFTPGKASFTITEKEEK